jgi:non-ribosomal peptide synthetase component F
MPTVRADVVAAEGDLHETLAASVATSSAAGEVWWLGGSRDGVQGAMSCARLSQLADAPLADLWDHLARRELHWFHVELHAWLSYTEGADWSGWDATTASATRLRRSWSPWAAACDEADAPFVRWYHGGLTNAAFNELDRAALSHEDKTAFVCDGGDGGCEQLSVRQLLHESVLVASALLGGGGLVLGHGADGGLAAGDRLALYLPNSLPAVIWVEAAKRCGVPYVAVAGGTASRSLADRLVDTSARALVTSDSLLPAAQAARQLMTAPPSGVLASSTVVPPVDGWQVADVTPLRARLQSYEGCNGAGEASDDGPRFVRAHWQAARALPVDACFPLFVLYTSGSTGKPKGIVHTHGGYEVGLCLTSRVVFAFSPASDVFLVIATPGWITGQSYMIAAAMLCCLPSVLIGRCPRMHALHMRPSCAKHPPTC